MKIPMKLVYQYMVIFFNFSLTSNHFHSLQVENCDSNSRFGVDKDDYGKLRLERVNPCTAELFVSIFLMQFPASNDTFLILNYRINRFTKHLLKTILSILVIFLKVKNK